MSLTFLVSVPSQRKWGSLNVQVDQKTNAGKARRKN